MDCTHIHEAVFVIKEIQLFSASNADRKRLKKVQCTAKCTSMLEDIFSYTPNEQVIIKPLMIVQWPIRSFEKRRKSRRCISVIPNIAPNLNIKKKKQKHW